MLPCVCGHVSAMHYAHTGRCYDPDCGCSYFLADDGEREPETVGGKLPDPYTGQYGRDKEYRA